MKDIKELALELGYEVVDNNIFLPLGSFRGWEYGLSMEGESLRVYAKDEEIKYGKDISCYTAHSLIKTLEFGEREFLIQRKDSEIENKKVGLLYAFKNPELQLDSSIKTKILRSAAVIIPQGYEILEREIIELQDKISEAKEISSIPGYENILKNLNIELAGLADSYFSLEPEKIRIDEITIEGDFKYVGYGMKGGNLVVNGDVDGAGRGMKGGNLVVSGDVERFAGIDMKGGSLVVNGDVDDAGRGMEGGNLVVKGNVKGYAGYGMESGTLVVSGDVDYAGWSMKGGNLVVKGNVKGYAGYGMESGNLVVKGDVKWFAGTEMESGNLVVSGDVGYAGDEMRGGTLVVKGNVKYAGWSMKSGNLVVNGDVDYAGGWMKGGTLVVKGDVRSAGHGLKGGNLIVKGNVMEAGRGMRGGNAAIYGEVCDIGPIYGGKVFIDFDKNPGLVKTWKVRPIEEFDGGLDERH
jgi:formylmethanofuran dehydrogenase subunit C